MKIVTCDYETFVEKDFERYVKVHERMSDVTNPLEQYKVALSLLEKDFASQQEVQVLNMCAGTGSLLLHIHQRFPQWKLQGVDTSPLLVNHVSSQKLADLGIPLQCMTVNEAGEKLHSQFDAVLHWMRLLHFDDWQAHLRASARAVKPGGRVYISSLFNDSNVDILSTVADYTIPACVDGTCVQYHMFSGSAVLAYAKELGAKEAELIPFELNFDIPKKADGVGTYTIRTEDGKRLQISAGIRMNWQILKAVF